MPGRGDHPAGGGQADQRPRRVPWPLASSWTRGIKKLLWSLPNATRNTKLHGGKAGSARRSRTAARRPGRSPQAAANDNTTVAASSGATTAPSTSGPKMTSTTTKTRARPGGVVAGGPLDVEVDRAGPADLGVGARDGADPVAQPVHAGIARLAVGALVRVLQGHIAAAWLGRVTAVTPGVAATAARGWAAAAAVPMTWTGLPTRLGSGGPGPARR
jgi:hypothetical protein